MVRDIGAGEIQVVFLDTSSREDDLPAREVLRGELVGTDPFTDTAVLKVNREKRVVPMRPLPIGESASLEVGQSVYAIGNPFGLDHSMRLSSVHCIFMI